MSWETSLDEKIVAYLPELRWLRDEPLAKHTSFRIGGPARRMAFPKTAEELIVLDGLKLDAIKTKEFKKVLDALKIQGKERASIIKVVQS